MNRIKSKKIKTQKLKRVKIDRDHFTVFNLKPDWEKQMADVWSPDEIQKFKERQKLLNTIPLEQRLRTKVDKSYREGWVDAAKWIHQEMQKIFHSDDNNVTNGNSADK